MNGPFIIRTERGYLLNNGQFSSEIQQFHEHRLIDDYYRAVTFCEGYRLGAGEKAYAVPVEWEPRPVGFRELMASSS